jgi:hypothetical protein
MIVFNQAVRKQKREAIASKRKRLFENAVPDKPVQSFRFCKLNFTVQEFLKVHQETSQIHKTSVRLQFNHKIDITVHAAISSYSRTKNLHAKSSMAPGYVKYLLPLHLPSTLTGDKVCERQHPQRL